jgi:hypothetical protein
MRLGNDHCISAERVAIVLIEAGRTLQVVPILRSPLLFIRTSYNLVTGLDVDRNLSYHHAFTLTKRLRKPLGLLTNQE